MTVPTTKNASKLPHGETIYRDVKFIHRVCTCNKPPYTHLLKVSIVSPSTGKILRSKRKIAAYQRRKSKSNEGDSPPKRHKGSTEYANAYRTVYLKGYDAKTIKAKLNEIIPHLYADFQDELYRALRETSSDVHARTAYEMMHREFFSNRNTVSKKTLKEQRSIIRKFCDLIDAKPLSALTESDIKKAVSCMAEKKHKKLRLIEAFFEFCGENNLYSGQNPISKYLGSENTKKRPSSNGQYPHNSTHLSDKCERTLHRIIEESINEDLALAIPLVKGFRISIDQLLTLTWNDIPINGKEVQILQYLPNLTGGTHNYTRPPLRETADFLLKKYRLLLKNHSENRIKKMLVVPVPGKTISEKKAALSKYFRTTLLAAGVSQADIQQAARPEETKAAGGAAYTLLCRHYDYVLKEQCEIETDSGVGCYLRGVRIHDTTNDYYRSFSDETGNHTLQTIMNRDDRFREIPAKPPEITEQYLNGYQEVIIPSGPPETRSGVITKEPIFIPKGTIITIGGLCGVNGNISFSNQPNLPTPSKRIELY